MQNSNRLNFYSHPFSAKSFLELSFLSITLETEKETSLTETCQPALARVVGDYPFGSRTGLLCSSPPLGRLCRRRTLTNVFALRTRALIEFVRAPRLSARRLRFGGFCRRSIFRRLSWRVCVLFLRRLSVVLSQSSFARFVARRTIFVLYSKTPSREAGF